MISANVVLVYDDIPKVARRLPGLVDEAIGATAAGIESHAKQLAPVDTGFLRNSITSGRVQRGWWRVAVGADYGPHLEYGTRYMPAQPFLTPAARSGIADLRRRLGRL